jgi:hypothetical protein
VTPAARNRAITDTRDLFADRQAFLERLNRDIANHVQRARRDQLIPLVRLNVASDLDWVDVVEQWPDVQFYDYTKIRLRYRRYFAGELPGNHSLTFSRHERHHHATIGSFLSRGGNVAQVFDVDYYPAVGRIGDLPESAKVNGRLYRVVDGDKHDIRLPIVDGRGVIIGLRLKGTNAAKSRARQNGFASGWNHEGTTAANGRFLVSRH